MSLHNVQTSAFSTSSPFYTAARGAASSKRPTQSKYYTETPPLKINYDSFYKTLTKTDIFNNSYYLEEMNGELHLRKTHTFFHWLFSLFSTPQDKNPYNKQLVARAIQQYVKSGHIEIQTNSMFGVLTPKVVKTLRTIQIQVNILYNKFRRKEVSSTVTNQLRGASDAIDKMLERSDSERSLPRS